MASVGMRDLKQRASQIVRSVQETGEPVEVTRHGRPVARIVPLAPRLEASSEAADIWDEMDRLARELSRRWPQGLAAADAVAEQRREL
jgi:prevent-host-death family protein